MQTTLQCLGSWHDRHEIPANQDRTCYCVACDVNGERESAYLRYLRSLPRPADPYDRD